jgi:DNA-binding beta-propeller fold protein YncE
LSFFRDGKKKHITDYTEGFGAEPTSPGVDRSLRGLAIDEKAGDIYVADSHKIDRIDRLGRLVTVSGSRRDEGLPKPPVDETAGLAGQQFDSIAGIAYAPDGDMLYVADGNLHAILPNNQRSGILTAPLELPDGTYESGFGRRGVAYDAKSRTAFGAARTDDAIVMLGERREPKVPVDKLVLEDVVRMTVGSDGNLYLSGGRRVYVFAPPAP